MPSQNDVTSLEGSIAPSLSLLVVPEDQRDAVMGVNSALIDVMAWSSAFKSALALFDWCIAQRQLALERDDADLTPGQWQQIAARDGAMSAYHAGKAINAVFSNRKHSALMQAVLDENELGDIVRPLRNHFRDIEPFRNAVAHAAELTKSPKDSKKNQFSGDYNENGVRLSNVSDARFSMLNGRRLTMTGYDGKVLSYDLDYESLHIIESTRCKLFGKIRTIFSDIEEPLLGGRQDKMFRDC